MAKKNPTLPQINPGSGVRTYVVPKGNYVQRMRGNVDRAMEYALRNYKMFMKHSEFKKPYQAVNYDDMEYETPDWPNPGPGPGPAPEPPPGIDPPPSPGPGPGPVPSPGPSPPPTPPPWWNDVWFCDLSTFYFCPSGPAVAIPINTNDQIGSITVGFGGGGTISGRSFIPGSGTGSVSIYATTAHGATCSGLGYAKDPSECIECGSPSIGYTTTGMDVNETQQLTVVGGGSGPYTWSVSGGGSITNDGLYTAPSSNANCSSNPTISLVCGSRVMDTLTIAINGWTGSEIAYWVIATTGAGCAWAVAATPYHCDGSTHAAASPCNTCTCGNPECCCNYKWGPPPTCEPWVLLYCLPSYIEAQCGGQCTTLGGCTNGAVDVRTGAMTAGGCCPAALL